MHSHRSGFTLIELSVVIVILGLLVGGILGGQSLIQAQRVRNVLTDAKTYALAMQQFKDKYGYLPGDFPTATSVWGSSSTYCSGANNLTSGTCNGNGDGTIALGLTANTSAEMFQAWKQMALAGLIQGNFTGVSGAGAGVDSRPGTNVPLGPIAQSGFTLGSYGTFSGDTNRYDGNYDNVIHFGLAQTNFESYGAALLPKEAYDLDVKADLIISLIAATVLPARL
jgi:prepilin-type N-terminal cleavage/methylation domain-containing protein